MPLSPDLWTHYDPPAVWVTLDQPVSPEASSRLLTMRVKETGRRSVSVNMTLDRYSPEDTIFRAVAETIKELSAAQREVTRDDLGDALTRNVLRWVDPF
jgi:hypothetical protein